jgi:hypothetical protein
MDQQWPWWDIPRIFVRIGARFAGIWLVKCAQVARVVFFGPGVFTPESTLS